MPLRRAGTVPSTGVRYGPGSAAHHAAKGGAALRCVRGTQVRIQRPSDAANALPSRNAQFVGGADAIGIGDVELRQIDLARRLHVSAAGDRQARPCRAASAAPACVRRRTSIGASGSTGTLSTRPPSNAGFPFTNVTGMKGGTPLLAISTSCMLARTAKRSHRDEFGAKAERAAEAGMHRMQQMLLELIRADAEHRADQRRHAARHPRHRDLQIRDGVEPRQCGIVDGLGQQFVIQRPDRAERLAAAPGRDIEILQMRAAAVDTRACARPAPMPSSE